MTCSRPCCTTVVDIKGVIIGRSGYGFGQQGEERDRQGAADTLDRFWGCTPPHVVVKRGSYFVPSFAAAPSVPVPRSKKNNGARVRHALRVSCQRVGIEF